MKTPIYSLLSITLLLAASACSDDPSPGDASTIDAMTQNDAAPTDIGFPDGGTATDAAPDGGPTDTGPGLDAAPGDAIPGDSAQSVVRLSQDVLVRPSRFRADGRLFAYYDNYVEQMNQLASTGELHLYNLDTEGDARVGSNISLLGTQFSSDWGRVLYFQRIDTTDFTAPAFAYDRAADTSLRLADAAFFSGLLAADGSAAVVVEGYQRAISAGDVLRWDWPAASSAAIAPASLPITKHDLPNWFLYIDTVSNALHLSQISGDRLLADDVIPVSVTVSDNRSAVVYLRATGGALERLDIPGGIVSSTIASNVRRDILSISPDGARVIYGTGATTDLTTDLYLSTVGSAPISIATGVAAQTVIVSSTLQAVTYCVATTGMLGDLYRWSAVSGAQLVASGVNLQSRSLVADDGTVVVYFSTFNSGMARGQLSRWTNGGSEVLGEDVSLNGMQRTPNLERLAFIENVNAQDRGDLVVYTGTLPTVPIASGVIAQLSLGGGTSGYYASPTLDRMVAFVPGASAATGDLYGWRLGGTGALIVQGVPSTSWRISPDATTMVFVTDFVDETTGADHGTLQVVSESAPAPMTLHPSVSRFFTLSNDHVAYVGVRGATPQEDGLFLAPLP